MADRWLARFPAPHHAAPASRTPPWWQGRLHPHASRCWHKTRIRLRGRSAGGGPAQTGQLRQRSESGRKRAQSQLLPWVSAPAAVLLLPVPSTPTNHLVLRPIHQRLPEPVCNFRSSLSFMLGQTSAVSNIVIGFRRGPLQPFHNAGIVGRCLGKALPDLAPRVVAPGQQLRRLQRTVLDRIEAEIRFALLAERLPFGVRATLLERLRIAQPAQQQARWRPAPPAR